MRPLASNASRSCRSISESSPSTIPASRRRRSPVVPRARVDSTCVRNRSPTPPIPPRRPTIRAPSPRRTTCTPRRESQPRSSKPVSGPRGVTGRARNSRTAPWGGARSGGSSRRTRSRMSVGPKRSTSAGTRNANGVLRTGPVVTTRTEASCPKRPARKLRSSASPRIVPHHSPAHASAAPAKARRRVSLAKSAPMSAEKATSAASAAGGLSHTEMASPMHADPTRSAGQLVSRMRLMASRAL
jgi:hypothetical protein